MADLNVGDNGVIRITATIVGSNASQRWTDIAWVAQLRERTASTFGWASATPASVQMIVGGSVVSTPYNGTFAWDFRPSGAQVVTIASGTFRLNHNANGTAPSFVARLNLGASGTQTVGGPATVNQSVSVPTLTVAPSTPTGVSATRVSDTQTTVSWSQSSASNGQPTSNTIQQRVNGGAWTNLVTVSVTTSATVSTSANRRTEYRVRGNNSAGSSSYSAASSPIYTTPLTPNQVTAAKDAALDINVSWNPRVGFSEHQHQVEFSTNGGSSWSTLATVGAASSTFKHVSPNPALVHVYRVRARNTATPNLTSAWVQSNSVQLLAPPNAPTLANIPTFADKTLALPVSWAHNPVDTTEQTAYEMQSSTNGGTSWTTTGKVTSATSQHLVAADTYAADVALTVRVRTWGQATSGGADGTGASPWSTTDTVVFKTRPVVTILTPANGSTWDRAELNVGLGFSQAEGATFVQATIVLSQGATVLETVQSNTLAATLLATTVVNGGAYTLTVTAVDSNGIVSAAVVADFTVAYTPPVAAAVQLEYLDESGVVQVGIAVPDPLAGEAAAAAVTVLRSVDGGAFETLLASYPLELPTPNSVQLNPNVFTNPSFETASGTVSTPEGVQPVPVGVVNDGEPTIWQSDTRAAQGTYSAAFYWPPEPIFPGNDLFPDDDVFPG